eukprot:2632451-Prymnesium_polylepis.1
MACASRVVRRVDSAVGTALNKMTSACAKLPDAASAQLAASLGSTVQETFKSTFAAAVVPGFERASQKMFEDLHAAFKLGIDEFQVKPPPPRHRRRR